MPPLEPQAIEGQELSDRVRVGRLRAVGWMGYVYSGDLLSLGRPVASCSIKLLHPRPMCSPETLLQDLREQARYVHPHLLALQQSGIARSGPARDWIWLVHELADGSLQDLLSGGLTLTPTQVREMLVDLLEALRYLHNQGLTHGEVRPPNVLSTTTGWRLGGLEYRGTLGRRLEEVGASRNHFVFRAPETHERGADHSSADMWSVAVLTHAALTGRLPFNEQESRDRSDLQWRIANQQPSPDTLGEPFDSLLQNCLVREPRNRWTAEQALAALGARPHDPVQVSLSGFALPAAEELPPPPLEEEPEVPAPSPAFVAIGIGLVVVGLFIGKFLLPPPPRRVPQVDASQLQMRSYAIGHVDSRGRVSNDLAQAPVLKETLDEVIAMELVQVPTGDFEQGSPDTEIRREPDESPRRRVRLDTFYMGRTEVTQAQWAAVSQLPAVDIPLPPAPSNPAGADLPVSGVTYDQAREYCARLTHKLGRLHRLPTEAEWEYACRGGPIEKPFGLGDALVEEVANFNPTPPWTASIPAGAGRHEALAVDAFPYANHFGLLQMHGNVKEWCGDFYAAYTEAALANPSGPADGTERVVRGGSFRSPAERCRSAARFHEPPGRTSNDIGFRVVIPEVASLQAE